MINKVLNMMKVGSAKVDLKLEANELKHGDHLNGVFELKGGWVSSKLKRLECDLVRECPGKKPEFIEPVQTLLTSKTINTGEQQEIPFSYQIPAELEPTSSEVKYSLHTKVVFSDDVKCMDSDEIVIKKQSL
ncbi:sporulation protein [Radiobacillus kanasensis]|uniref:sporulation protein n=1 Tax=Radiobacillus kanasensis TaxID=2844358 RepID=UPI001E531773|nr:sporulation protein [Radiobacillus kanasensis]UFT99613.1 sporulation protein [Radiobacillus kanasensis]